MQIEIEFMLEIEKARAVAQFKKTQETYKKFLAHEIDWRESVIQGILSCKMQNEIDEYEFWLRYDV